MPKGLQCQDCGVELFIRNSSYESSKLGICKSCLVKRGKKEYV